MTKKSTPPMVVSGMTPPELARELTVYYQSSLDRSLPDIVVRPDKLRVSGFPYCALVHAFKKMNKACKEGPQVEEGTAFKDFYTSFGTAAHLAFQRWLGSNGRIWGDWKCYNKSCGHKVEFSPSIRCPKCGSEMEYEEFEVEAFNHLSGHIDGVYEAEDGSFWVIDYKTSSLRIVATQDKEPTLPYAKNKAQIMAYCALIEKKHKIKISGWALLYIARDNPRRIHISADTITDKVKQRIYDKCRVYDEQFEVVQSIRSWKDIVYLIDTKPCATVEFYSKHMGGFSGCQLQPVCFHRPSLDRVLKPALEDYLQSVKSTKLSGR